MPFSDDAIRGVLDDFAKVGPQPPVLPDSLPALRRGRKPPLLRPPAHVALVKQDGVLFWDWGHDVPGVRPSAHRAYRAGLRRAAPGGGTTIYSDELPPLGVNQIQETLLGFDVKCNADFDTKRGWTLRRLDPASLQWVAPTGLPPDGKVLLIVHGTASSCGHILDEIKLAPAGAKFLTDAAAKYTGGVLAFDHPTLAFSPILNALDLASALTPYAGRDIDIVCHSRGGLVTSWWMHLVDRQPRVKRCVFVGSPLQGTSLANPAKLRSSLHLLSNYASILGDIGKATPFFALPFTIIKVAASVVDFTAKVPLLDAALAMIPGLCAQSRTDNNAELLRLNQQKSAQIGQPTQFYIRANFDSPQVRHFWEVFTQRPGQRILNTVVDNLVFPAANDMVVDTDTMTDAVGGPAFDFSATAGVHHTNYFENDQTIGNIRTWLGI